MPTEDPAPNYIDLDDLAIAIQSTRLILYELHGCPMGETYAGFQAWTATKERRFTNLCEWGKMDDPTLEERLDSGHLLISAIAYQVYKSLGSPNGATVQGFEDWVEAIQNELMDVLEVDSRE